MVKFIFTADLHGNIVQYNKLFNFAKQENIDLVILGGDLTPKDEKRRSVVGQRNFILKELFPLIQNIQKQNPLQIALIMGNDDYKANQYLFEENQEKIGFRLIDEVPFEYGEYIFAGYTYVPYTPFQWKDWEKRDLHTETDVSFREDTRIEGFISQGDDNKVPYSIYETMMDNAIDLELSAKYGKLNPKKLVLITHAPPYNTVCDYTAIKQNDMVIYKHVGSRGVLEFIKKYQPLFTLHGHIHDAGELSKNFYEKIGETTVITVSNDHQTNDLKIIIYDSKNQHLERKSL